MAEEVSPYALVVIGSSAGGIEALSTLVRSLPAGFAAPIVIAQHLDPTRTSHLPEILGQRAALPVRTVAEQAPLEPGVIFVVPANRHVEIGDSQVVVRPDGAARSHPSVDLLFASAARAFGERLIAVVLTGTGSDGAAGAREVKQAGGTVIIQNPDTAAFPGMPESLAPTSVDIVADLETIGSLLTDLVRGAAMPAPPERDRNLAALLEELREQSGIDFSSYKPSTIMRRLQRRLVATGITDLPAYIGYLQSHPEEYRRLLSSFLINATEFFGDPELFTYLREQLLPQLVADGHRRGNELRLWSAGCATGEEAYSLAITLAEVLGDELERFSVRLFATDLDGEAVAFARRGIYPAAALANLSPDLVARYFTALDGEYEIKKRVRSLTVFGQHDLGRRAPFPRIDLILCRNVLTYFTAELQKRALQIFAFSLRDGGCLILGASESNSQLAEFFVMEESYPGIYRRHGERLLIPPARIKDSPLAPSGRSASRRLAAGMAGTGAARRDAPPLALSSERLASLLLDLPIGVALVDRRYDIQAINNTARRLLGIHGTALGEDLIHLTRSVPSERLRRAVDAAFRGETSAEEELITVEDPPGESLHYRIACSPYPLHDQDGPAEAVLVVMTDVSALVHARGGLEAGLVEEREASLRHQQEAALLSASLQRLAETNRQLLEANQELASANSELRSTNEEFLVTGEEAQAASEEVETLNEELQATNEELETLNEELQATVEELNTTNDDLQARSAELQDLAISLEAQRRESDAARERLEAVLQEIGDAVLVVDSTARPILVNRAYAELFGGEDAVFRAEDRTGRPLPPEATPQRRAANLESFSMEFTASTADGGRRWFEANGRPVRGARAERLGVVVLRDITERGLRRLQEQRVAMATHELRNPLTALQGSLQLLARRLGTMEDARNRNLLDMALGQAQQLDRLTSDLADVVRLQLGRLQLSRRPVDLEGLARRVVESTRVGNEGRNITLEAAGSPLIVEGDAARLEQVVANLLHNALVHATDSERIEVRVRREGTRAVLEVQDYGPGIAEAERQMLFEPFSRGEDGESRHRGLGLGLYIARELVEAHGGAIDLQSTPGAGATFTVRLPLAPAGETPTSP